METAMQLADEKFTTARDMLRETLREGGIENPDEIIDDIKENIKEDCGVDIDKDKPSEFMLCFADFSMDKEIKSLRETIYDACENRYDVGEFTERFICPMIEDKIDEDVDELGDLDEWAEEILSKKIKPEISDYEEVHYSGDMVAEVNVDNTICKPEIDGGKLVIDCGYYRGRWETDEKVYVSEDDLVEKFEDNVSLADYLNKGGKLLEKYAEEYVNEAVEDVADELDEGGDIWYEQPADDVWDIINTIENYENEAEIEDPELWEKIKKGEVDEDELHGEYYGVLWIVKENAQAS